MVNVLRRHTLACKKLNNCWTFTCEIRYKLLIVVDIVILVYSVRNIYHGVFYESSDSAYCIKMTYFITKQSKY